MNQPRCILMAAATATALVAPAPSAVAADSPTVRYRTIRAGGVEVFFREAGPAGAPTVVLLHGFPSSSFMFRDLIPALADRYHVLAPDYPGFGHSGFPARATFRYTFEHLADVVEAWLDALGIGQCAFYIQDYGAPVGLRVAIRRPERISALIVQNGNAYEEGLSEAWEPLRRHWRRPTATTRARLRGWLTAEGVRQQYVLGLPPPLAKLVSPDVWTMDWSRLQRPGNVDVQLDLFSDYAGNVALYPEFQRFFRERRPPTLVVWGRHDPFFTIRGAEAYRRDLPSAELHLLEAGHFALETAGAEIAALMRDFLARNSPR